MTDYDVLFYEGQERRKREDVAPHILHGKVKELQEEVHELRETLKQETVHLMDALNQIKLRREESEEAEQILGKALGYPPYPIVNGLDYRENPAVKTDEPDNDWVCVGDNTLLSLCDEIADKIRQFENEADWLAGRISITDICANPKKNAKDNNCGGDECAECWREAARKAVYSSTSH